MSSMSRTVARAIARDEGLTTPKREIKNQGFDKPNLKYIASCALCGRLLTQAQLYRFDNCPNCNTRLH